MKRLWLAIGVFCAIFAAVQTYRWTIWSFGADTGTFSQIVLDAFGGFRDGPEQGTHFRFHWAPLLAALYPLVALTRSGLALQYAQFVLIAFSALPLYALARRYAGEGTALCCAVLPLIYPPLLGVAFGEFHEIAFYPVLALALVWAADAQRWAAFALLAAASALVREECCIVFGIVGLVLALIGAVRARRGSDGAGLLFFRPRRPRAVLIAGVALAAVNAAALGVYFLLVIPRVGVWQPVHFYDYPFAYGPLAVVFALLVHPALIGRVITPAKLGYLLEALTPLAFLPLRSKWSLLALPGLAGLLLSSEWGAFRMGSHYAAVWIPWLLLGSAATILSLERAGGVPSARRAFGAVAILCALFFAAFNPLHPLHFLRPVYAHDAVAPLLRLVPQDASLITHDEWFAHVAGRYPRATIFAYTPHRYALFADDYPNAFYQSVTRPQLLDQAAHGRARVLRRIGKVALWQVDAPEREKGTP